MMELKPCPFCGGKADIGEQYDGLYFVICTACLSSSPSSKSKELVERHWNRRVTNGTERKADEANPRVFEQVR